MRTHPLNPNIALPSNLAELKTVQRDNGVLCLTDGSEDFNGAFFNSPEFKALAESFNYEAHGYGALLPGPDMPERAPIADFYKGKVFQIKQATFDHSLSEFDNLPIEALESDLERYLPDWTVLFNRFANLVAPAMGDHFEIRLKCLPFGKESFHTDEDIIGILPLGEKRKSTICSAEDGSSIVVEDTSFVITTPSLPHKGPFTNVPRAALGVTKYDFQIN